jgi:TldD protein
MKKPNRVDKAFITTLTRKLKELKCDYADVRLEDRYRTLLTYRNYEVQNGIELADKSAFIRVFNNGRWFYASQTDLSSLASELDRLVLLSQTTKGDFKSFATPKPERKTLVQHQSRNACSYKILDKKKLVESLFPVYKKEKTLVDLMAAYGDWYVLKTILTSKGSFATYDTTMFGILFYFTLKDGDRLFASKFSRTESDFGKLKGLQPAAENDLAEAKTFLYAPTVKPGYYPVVLSEEAAGVFAHESFGHKSEADFMLGDKKMIAEWKLGKRVGSPILSIVDDGTIRRKTGYCPFDDEGTKAQKTFLVKKGVLRGRLHSLQTASELKEKPTGNARAINAQFEPIVRMTNTYIEAGTKSFSALIANIKEGIYIQSENHGSGLSTFTIAPDRAYMIRNGKLAEPIRVSVISGNVFQTLKDINGLTNRVKLLSSIFGGCGKQEQFPLPVSFGGPKVRVRRMHVS